MSEILYEKLGKIVEVKLSDGRTVNCPETVFSIGSFWGGNIKGKCIQITTDSRKCEQLTKSEIKEIIKVLKKWVESK